MIVKVKQRFQKEAGWRSWWSSFGYQSSEKGHAQLGSMVRGEKNRTVLEANWRVSRWPTQQTDGRVDKRSLNRPCQQQRPSWFEAAGKVEIFLPICSLVSRQAGGAMTINRANCSPLCGIEVDRPFLAVNPINCWAWLPWRHINKQMYACILNSFW